MKKQNVLARNKWLIFSILLLILIPLILIVAQIPAKASSLWDVQNHWAKPYIEYMEKRGAINGYEDGSFKPENNVTNGEALKLVMATFEDDIAYYQDGHWATNFMQAAKDSGIVKTYKYNQQNLDDNALRKEVIYMIYNSLTKLAHKPIIMYNDIDMKFTDLNESINEYEIDYYTAIRDCYLLGIVEGDDTGLMNPNEPITRAEMVTLLSRAYSEEWRKYPTTEKSEINDVLPKNVTAYKKIWAYMPNNFYEAGKSSWAEYVSGGEPVHYLDAYKRIVTNDAMKTATARVEKGMSALLNVSYKMTEEEWQQWKIDMEVFMEPADFKEEYIQYVKTNQIEVRGGVVMNPCTIGTVYIDKKEGTTSLAMKGIIDYEVINNPNEVEGETYDKFLRKDMKIENDRYILVYLGVPGTVTELYNVYINMMNN